MIRWPESSNGITSYTTAVRQNEAVSSVNFVVQSEDSMQQGMTAYSATFTERLPAAMSVVAPAEEKPIVSAPASPIREGLEARLALQKLQADQLRRACAEDPNVYPLW
jgi:hypothetical protein